ncbi:fer-1-like protein 4 isoform X10 [Pongo abelii]|uniref:fer-1-like protein 4 isoform X10 n=1 Tax=Pongo abelii TaxID=9601 RepID=UPI0023E792E6|nr:fer-1-like protein 4 isoform X10 [Pongo abelii]
MALTVCVQRLTGLTGTHDRQVKLTFRGFTQKTRKIHCGQEADIGELFRWPHYGAPLAGECLSVQVVNCSRVFSPRPLGTLVISLQQLQNAGHLVLREALVDENLRVSPIQVELDLKYQPPEGAIGAWSEEEFGAPIQDSLELIVPNVGFQELEPGEAQLERRAVALGRRLARSLGQQDDEENELELELEQDLDDEPDVELSGLMFSPLKSRTRALAHGDPFQVSRAQDFQVQLFFQGLTLGSTSSSGTHVLSLHPGRSGFLSSSFCTSQVGVTVLEAQKLVGVNINPYVAVQVGGQRRVTATQRGTSCPFYNEVGATTEEGEPDRMGGVDYFLFEFHDTWLRLQDLLLEITAFHSQTLPFMATRIGTFRMDLGIILDQPDGQFYQRWAPLHDPQDTRAGTKGFVKVTLSVRARGDLPPPMLPPAPGHCSDIEKNLLLPRGVPAERPWARLRVRLYRAEGLPALRPGLLGSLARALHDQRVLVEPYVQVSFLGQEGETSVRAEAAAPEWNEQLSFVELFPPLTRSLRLQLRDNAPLVDAALATHVLDLRRISHPGRAAGFNPTFGPAWVPLYGSPPGAGLRDGLQGLNEGVGQGIWFRGRLLLAVSMQVLEGRAEPEPPQAQQGSTLSRLTRKKKKKARRDQTPKAVPQHVDASPGAEGPEIPSAMEVEVEELLPLPENVLAPCEDFLLFGVLFEATMIDPAVASQPISFEISIGRAGRLEEPLGRGSRAGEGTEGAAMEAQPLLGARPEEEKEEEELGTPAQRPEPMDGSGPYFCLPLRHCKPCVHVWSCWEDHTWRLQSSNCVRKVAERLDQGLQEVERLQRRPGPGACAQLKEALEVLVAGSRQFCRGAERRTMTRPNALDRCRGKLLVHSLNLLAKQGLRLLHGLRRGNVQKKVALAKKLLAKLRFLTEEPQPPLPDVLVWMLSGQRRVAWARIPAQDVLFSVVEEERGRDCGKIQSLMLTAPGAAPGEVCAKLELFLWLGLGKQAKACTSELPPDLLPEPSAGLPSSLHRDDFSYFQLRAHLYQARGVLAADDSGLSDPFARVLISTQCQTTRVLEQTLSPLWDELLVFEQLIVDGRREHLQEEPPLVIINVFDHNKFGPPVFLGRALAAPKVKLMEDPYQRPELQFFPLRKGPQAAGELIAAFELIELDYSGRLEPSVPSDVEPQDLAPLVEPHSGRLSLPPNVCPVLREFRVEVLFWGLRGLGRVHLFEVEQPQVVLEVAGQRVESEVLASYRESPNFTELVRHLTVDLPEQPYLQPPLSILVIERRAFGRTVLVGSHIVPHMLRFTFRGHEDPPEEEGEMEETGDMMPKGPQGQKSLDPLLAEAGISRQLLKPPLKKLPLGGLLNQGPGLEEDIPDPEELDWWSKYYASLQELQGQHNFDEDEMDDPGDSDGVNLTSMVGEIQDQGDAEVKGTVSPKKAVATLKIYNRSLEEEFNHFEDWLNVFPLYRGQGGQDGGGEEEGSGHLVGKFKGSFLIYPESEAVSFSEPQISRGIPQNRPIKLLVRVYIVKATNLAPADPNGKADPYVVVSAGRERQDTKERYIPKQLNPIFGEILELSISLPAETELTVAIFDHDLVGSDDLIGETHIDLENRFYSHHRANCGLASQYDMDGYNAWRDAFRPSQILAGLCQRCGLPAPEYRAGAVKVGSKVFLTPPETLPPGSSSPSVASGDPEEAQALLVLRRWQEMPGFGIQLVPEHVETRPLYHPHSPGLLQGSLHMWIDIFPRDVPAPPPVDIKPRQPISYELRVVIWNTEDVVLDDVNPLTGEMSSDIYVKSWVKGLEHDKQETDVHFNSLTGEGNFNWRFVFRFDYLPTEREVSVRRRSGPFALEEAEFRQPAVLVLQVWDYDRISANDFLGSLELQLSDMVRGARGPELCFVRLAHDGAGPRCNLFRCRRLRGWWPVVKLKEAEDVEWEAQEAQAGKKKRKQRRRKGRPEDLEFTDTGGNVYILTGKVEAEFELLTVEEAEKRPVGKGRKEPEPLEKPSRPKTSFNWFVNPLKTFVFFIWHRYWRILVPLLLLALLTVFLLLVFYTIPGQISEVIFRPLHK